jgi:4-amino-4-deoxy-L-arabinose transferase-like glycosyltransferase
LIKKLLGTRTALIATVFIGLSPILIGMSIYVNSDSLLWIFLPLTILSFLVYQKLASKKYLILSAILLGLALLTKYVAVILFPFLFILIFLKYIFDNNDNTSVFLKRALVDYLILIFISTAVIFVLFPVMWVRPENILEFTIFSRPFLKIWPLFLAIIAGYFCDAFIFKKYFIRKISDFVLNYKVILVRAVCAIAIGLIMFVIVNTYSGMKMIDFPSLLSDPRSGANQTALIHVDGKIFENILASFYSLIFGLTPIVAVSFISAIIFALKAKKEDFLNKRNGHFIIAFYLIFFILVYYVASSLLGVGSIVRYQVSLYPIASIVAAIGLSHVLNHERIGRYFKVYGFYVLISILMVFSAYSLYLIKPFYLEYSSSFLPKNYMLNLDNSEDGSSEISQYLNGLPDAKNLYVWTDERRVCEKFVGRCAFGLKNWSSSDVTFDYFVVPTVAGEQDGSMLYKNSSSEVKIGTTLINATDFYSPDRNYDFKIIIDGRKSSTMKVIKNIMK